MVIPGCDRLPESSDDLVFSHVCRLLNVNPESAMKNHHKRNREYVTARQATMTIFVTKRGYSQSRTGKFFNKDHATVIHAMKIVSNLLDTDKDFRNRVGHLIPRDVLNDLLNRPNNNGKGKTSNSGKSAVYARLPK